MRTYALCENIETHDDAGYDQQQTADRHGDLDDEPGDDSWQQNWPGGKQIEKRDLLSAHDLEHEGLQAEDEPKELHGKRHEQYQQAACRFVASAIPITINASRPVKMANTIVANVPPMQASRAS